MIEVTKQTNYSSVEIELEEANLESAQTFKEIVIQMMEGGQKRLVIDFRKVKYVDSTFMAALVSILKHAMHNQGDVAISGLNHDLLHLFRLIRMDKVFKIYDELPDSM